MGMYVGQIDNFMLWSCYQLLDEEEGMKDPIRVHASSRTVIHGMAMQSYLERRIRDVTDGTNIPKLEDICGKLPPDIRDQIFHRDPQQCEFLQALSDLILSSDEPLSKRPREVETFQSLFCRPTELELKVKFYIGREDVRAFNVDKCELRSLCGAIIHSILMPDQERIQKTLHWRWVLFRKDKNIINRKFFIPNGHKAVVVFGDISSFTSSNVNSWAYLYSMFLLIRTQGLVHLDEPFPISVNGRCLEVKLSEVIFLYLYLTVLTKSQFEGKEFTSLGGYLGVAANMTLTTLSFALKLTQWRNIIRDLNKGLTFQAQIGGDDFYIMIMGPRQFVDDQIWAVLTDIRETVGALRNPTIREIPNSSGSGICGEFCKKSVEENRMETGEGIEVTLQSKIGLPLFEVFFSDPSTLTHREKSDKILEVVFGVNNVLENQTDRRACVTLYHALICRLLNTAIVPIVKSAPIWVSYDNVEIDGIFATTNAIDRAEQVADIVCNHRHYRQSLKSKLLFLASIEKLKRVKVLKNDGEPTILLQIPGERVPRAYGSGLVMFPDGSLLGYLSVLTSRLKLASKVLQGIVEEKEDLLEGEQLEDEFST
jgi:hypothetical protein